MGFPLDQSVGLQGINLLSINFFSKISIFFLFLSFIKNMIFFIKFKFHSIILVLCFHAESGCLLPSLPSNAVFDGTSGIGFICDLNDNIVAPWPTSSYLLPSSCNRSMYKLYQEFLVDWPHSQLQPFMTN